jgi:hypothetical protein
MASPKNDTFVVVQLPEGEAATYENADAETQFGNAAQDANCILTHELGPQRFEAQLFRNVLWN